MENLNIARIKLEAVLKYAQDALDEVNKEIEAQIQLDDEKATYFKKKEIAQEDLMDSIRADADHEDKREANNE